LTSRIEFRGAAAVVARTPSFVDAPPKVEKPGAVADDVDLLDTIEADVTDPDVTGSGVDRKAPRIAEPVGDDLRWLRLGRIETEKFRVEHGKVLAVTEGVRVEGGIPLSSNSRLAPVATVTRAHVKKSVAPKGKIAGEVPPCKGFLGNSQKDPSRTPGDPTSLQEKLGNEQVAASIRVRNVGPATLCKRWIEDQGKQSAFVCIPRLSDSCP
jgi:hypothetical protein